MADADFEAYESKGHLLNGRYQYVSPIQQGSFGKVSLAYDTATHTEVALKAMYRLVPETRRMAHHEVQVLTRLGLASDNICKALDHFETTQYLVLVLEYCANGDLYDLIHSGLKLLAVDVWHIAKEMCSGIRYAHSRGVYHRDLKPENVLFTAHGHVKLCDWGLSCTTRQLHQYNVGTEKYMAPECFGTRAEADGYDAKYADYWSLGITLLTLVFGTAPFKPIGDKLLELDTNFKNFVDFGKTEVLYDIYPTMNANCFNLFMHLLKCSGKDDEENRARKIQERSVDEFLSSFEANWKFGLTIDEEYELDNLQDESDEAGETAHSDLFDMDHDDLGDAPDSLCDVSNYDYDDLELDGELESFVGVPIPKLQLPEMPQPRPEQKRPMNSIPSLVDLSSGKSWCDYDDEDENLGRLIEELKNASLTTISEERTKLAELGVQIHEQEINDWHAYEVGH